MVLEKLIKRQDFIDVFTQKLKLKQLTEVQQQTIVHLLDYKDVIVQSATGSGKTLAYVLPSLLIMLKSTTEWTKTNIGILVLVPSRELAHQVCNVYNPFVECASITAMALTGGVKRGVDMEKFKKNGGNVIIATPGRLEQLIAENKEFIGYLKSLEVLVVDEADRYSGLALQKSMTAILSVLPKQRRTALFSATQAKEMEEVVKFGLRNPFRITIAASIASSDVTPSSLANYYTVIDAEAKLYTLVEFIRSNKSSKILVFVSTCACVDYFGKILINLLKKRVVLALHGKKKKQRMRTLDAFKTADAAVMVSTDVMSRGIDVADIDWVIQFDVPRQSSGRSGRCGRKGSALLLLSTSEESYAQFVESYEGVRMEKMDMPTASPDRIEQLRKKVVNMAIKDRDILEKGSRAFVSFIQAYAKHDCHVVCKLRALDVIGCAHAYGLLRLPRMPELCNRDLSTFRRCDMSTATITFKNKQQEAARQKRNQQRDNASMHATEETTSNNNNTSTIIEDKEHVDNDRLLAPKVAKKRKRRDVMKKRREWDELVDDARLLKKFKRGRLSKAEIAQSFAD